MPQAVQRTHTSGPGITPYQQRALEMQHAQRTDPNFVMPSGYRQMPGSPSHIIPEATWMDKHAQQLILGTALGVGTLGFAPGGAFSGMMGGAGAGAGAGTAAAGGGVPSLGVTSGIAGAAGTGAGAAGAGAGVAGAAGGGGMWGTILKAALPLVLGQVAGRQQRNAAGQDAAGARLQDLMPLLMPLIQQQTQHNQTNYQQQQSQYGQIQPLQAAIAKMAMGLMPGGGR